MKEDAQRLLRQIRLWIAFIMLAIFLSGVTAFPLETELKWLNGHADLFPPFIAEWIQHVYAGVAEANRQFPFMAYGTDWLAFAHVVIAIAFIGPYRDPIKNIWVIEWGMICCVSVLPLALIAGPIRQIPFFHQIIDISFGLLGIIPMMIVKKKIKRLEQLV